MLLLASLLLSTVAAPSDWFGTWQSSDGDVIHFERDRVAWKEDGRGSFYRARYEDGRALLERWARPRVIDVRLEGEQLLIGTGTEMVPFTRTEELPAALSLPPVEMATDVEVDEDLVAAVQDDLAERLRLDQEVRGPNADMSAMRAVDEDNTEALLAIISELGWIDVERFGRDANLAAFLIVQHSGHLRLMKTTLPFIEADMRAGHTDGQNYALLYDRFEISLGRRQRYGTQLGGLPDGRSALMPLEDPEQVEAWRSEMGMIPLSEYLAYFERDGEPTPRLDDIDLFEDE